MQIKFVISRKYQNINNNYHIDSLVCIIIFPNSNWFNKFLFIIFIDTNYYVVFIKFSWNKLCNQKNNKNIISIIFFYFCRPCSYRYIYVYRNFYFYCCRYNQKKKKVCCWYFKTFFVEKYLILPWTKKEDNIVTFYACITRYK